MKFFLNQMVEVSEEEQGVFIRRKDHDDVVKDLESQIKIMKYIASDPDMQGRSRAFIEGRFKSMVESHYHVPAGEDAAARFCLICGRYYMHKAHRAFLP